ncbi:MAG: outer membrane protein transport protein [Alistipes sp.]|nr:outer membrane protein transport protein [Alistipes sp.]
MKRWILIIGMAVAAWGGVEAQQMHYNYEIGGSVLTRDALSTSDFFTLSQEQFNFGTARSMAMGGAFTSLGADQAAMVLNPAGLGMYRRGEFALTPMVTIANTETANTNPYGSTSSSRFALGNIGAVMNVFEGSGRLLSFNIGMGYTRLADYNYDYSFSYGARDGRASIADAMSMMLEAGGWSADQLNGERGWGIDPWGWPGVAAYKTYLVDQNPYGVWYPAEIGVNADIEGGTSVRSRGSMGEFSLAMGGNVDNKLYFGFTLGIRSLERRMDLYYGEAYTYGGGNGYDSDTQAVDADGYLLPSVMQSMGMEHRMRLEGVGVNFKLGVIYRPIAGLRLGFALHTPTFYSLDRHYETAMATTSLGPTSDTDQTTHEYTSDAVSPILEDNGPSSWDFVSPTRMMFGVSYTLGNVAVFSVDYERAWYNGIRVKNQPYLAFGPAEADFKQDFKTYFKGSNTLRAGVEVRPVPMLALRAGYGYIGSMLKDEQTILSTPAAYKTNYYTCGAGVNLGRSCYIDVAYCYAKQQMTEYMLFYGNRYPAQHSSEPAEIYESDCYTTELTRHNIALTFGVRF